MQNPIPTVKSPLRYPGGKQKIAPKLLAMFPPTVTELRDPMVGGGSIVLAAKQRNFAKYYWMNDVSEELMAFWRVAQSPEHCSRLISDLQLLHASFDSADQIKEYFNACKTERPQDPFRQATLFFFKNRVTFSGTTEAGGFSASAALSRFTKSSIDRLKPLPSVLQNVTISSGDFAPLIENPGKDVFLFLDPPHFERAKIYGPKGSLNNFDHERLAHVLRKSPHRFLITLDDCEAVRTLYGWARLREWNVRYGMTNCNADHKSKLGEELLIYNYEIPETS